MEQDTPSLADLPPPEGTLVARTTHPILPRQPSKNIMIP